MTTQSNSQNGSNGTGVNPEVPADDSNPHRPLSFLGCGARATERRRGATAPPSRLKPNQTRNQRKKTVQSPTERFPWMKDTRQWGVRAPLTPHGLTIESIATGVYGEIPDESREMTRMPRGSFATPGMPRLDNYSVNRKDELWSDNAATLYEEAIQRRWNAMQDIAWGDLPTLPEDFELAWCQLCTELGQHGTAEIDTIGQWLHRMKLRLHRTQDVPGDAGV